MLSAFGKIFVQLDNNVIHIYVSFQRERFCEKENLYEKHIHIFFSIQHRCQLFRARKHNFIGNYLRVLRLGLSQ